MKVHVLVIDEGIVYGWDENILMENLNKIISAS